MAEVYVGVGSNVEPEINIPTTLRQLKDCGRVAAVSTFYRTPAVGSPGSPDFYNGVIKIRTEVPPALLQLGVFRALEEAMGRVRTRDKWAPRPIDLDILIYDDMVIREPNLVVPHPDIRTRAFVATPLLELAGDMVLPDDDSRLADIAASMENDKMQPLPEFTQRLRWEIPDEP